MSSLLSTLLSLTSLDLGGAVTRRARGFGYTLVAGVFLLTAYVMGVGALAVYLSGLMSPWAALAVIAAGFAVAAGFTLWFSSLSVRAAEEQAKEVASARQRATLGTLTGLAVGGGSTKTLVIAALAGLLAGGLLGPKGGDSDD